MVAAAIHLTFSQGMAKTPRRYERATLWARVLHLNPLILPMEAVMLVKGRLFALAVAAGFYSLSAGASNAQSAIETVVFILSGHEINAPGSEWRGSLGSEKVKKEHIIKQVNNCVYEFTKDDIRGIVDFSRVKNINLRAMDNFGLFVTFGARIVNSPGAYCTNQGGTETCSGDEGQFTVNALDILFIRGDVQLEKSLQQRVSTNLERKKQAYVYFQQNFCKPRAF